MNTVSIGFLILFVTTILFVLRNEYTWRRGRDAIRLVSNWCDDLIKIKQYDMNRSYYEEMIIGYNHYMFDISKWGKYSRIKKEYQSLIKDYGDE